MSSKSDKPKKEETKDTSTAKKKKADKKAAKKRARPVKRFGVGFLSVTQLVLAVIIFICLNFVSSQHYRPFDLSDDLRYSLSSSTVRYLQSDDVQGRDSRIDMIVAFRADSPFYDRVRPLAEEYARESNNKVRLRLVDPVRANDLAEQMAAEYNITFNQDMVIIDARTAEERAAPTGNEISPNVNIVKLEDMVSYETDANNQRRIRGFHAETALRAGLVSAVEGKPRKMWVLSDKSNLTSEENEGVWQVLSSNLVAQNILPERVSLAGVDRIPDDVDIVAIIGAAYDVTEDELDVLKNYWRRTETAIFVTTGAREVPPLLRGFLRENGITPRNERVLTVDKESIRTTVQAYFTPGMDFTRDLWEASTLLEGTTRMLEVRENDETLLNRRILPFSLLESDEAYWGETKFPAETVEFNPEEDRKGPVTLAACVIKGNATDDNAVIETSRMIVISNTAFLSPQNARKINLDFLSTSMNWLVDRESLTGNSPSNLTLYKLPLLEAQRTFINRMNLFILPAVILVLGAMVWSSRRS